MTFYNYKILSILSFTFIIFSFQNINSTNLKITSIIILEKKITMECGINIYNKNEGYNVSLSIKKKNNETFVQLALNSDKFNITKGNILTNSVDMGKYLNFEKKKKFNLFKEGLADVNNVSLLFQEFLIDGGSIIINNDEFKVSGPIDAKVRLEYLFCTGEMFHPKYKD